MLPGKGSTVAVDEAQSGSAAAAFDAFDDEGDAFLDREAGGRCAHFGSHPARRHEKQSVRSGGMASREAVHEHVEGGFAGAVELPKARITGDAAEIRTHDRNYAACGHQAFEEFDRP